MFRCPHRTRTKWRRTFIKELRKLLEKRNTSLMLTTLLVESFYAVLHEQDFNHIPIPHQLASIAFEQAEIGWDQLLKGRMTTQWQQQYEKDLGPSKITKKQNGDSWATAIIDFVFKQVWILWNDLRNQDRHGRDRLSREQAEQRQAIYELTQVYDQYRDNIPPHLQWILEPPLETRLHWKTSMMRAWINSFKPILEEGYTDALATG